MHHVHFCCRKKCKKISDLNPVKTRKTTLSFKITTTVLFITYSIFRQRKIYIFFNLELSRRTKIKFNHVISVVKYLQKVAVIFFDNTNYYWTYLLYSEINILCSVLPLSKVAVKSLPVNTSDPERAYFRCRLVLRAHDDRLRPFGRGSEGS